MNNARKTFNVYLDTQLAAAITAGTLDSSFAHVLDGETIRVFTGRAANPRIFPPSVAVQWLDGDNPGRKPENRMRLVQIEVSVPDQDEDGFDAACEVVLEALGLRDSTTGMGTLIPKMDYTDPLAPVALGTQLIVRAQAGMGFKRQGTPQQALLRSVITLELEYRPG